MSRLRALVVATTVSVLAIGVAAAPAFADDVLQVSAPDSLTAVVGNSYEPTVTGGDDTLPTIITATTLDVCAVDTDGVTVLLQHAGSCTVDAQRGADTGSVTFTVAKAPQTIDFTQPDGGPVGGTETLTATSSAGLDVTFSSLTSAVCTVTGDQVSYDHVGTCTVAADQSGTNDYLPAAEVTHDVQVAALDQSIQNTGGPTDGQVGDTQALSATSESGADVTFTSATTDVCSVADDAVTYEHVGTCTVTASAPASGDYAPATLDTDATVSKGDQTITVANTVPTSLSLHGAYVDDPRSKDITATSGLPVTATVDAATTDNGLGKACSVTSTSTGFTISADHAGTCYIDLSQPGDDDYNAAPAPASPLQFTIAKADQHVYLGDITSAARTVGSTYTLPSYTIEEAQNQDHPLSLSTQSTACTVDGVKHTVTLVHTGDCTLVASADGTADYNALTNATLPSFTVSKGASTVSVAPTSTTITATVAQASGSGAVVDGSKVTFSVGDTIVGSATVSNGVATLTYHVPTGAKRTIGATYAGSSDLTSDTGTYLRTDPKVTVASVKSAAARTKYGWYRKPVTTTFACSKGSSTVTSCSKPVTLIANGKRRAVTGKAAAADGGASTIVSYVNIDGTAPKVSVSGPSNGAVYVGSAPKAKCVGSDALSGIATCTLRIAPHANGVFTYAASAVDKAGNTSRVTGSYRVQNRYIRDAIFDSASNSYIVQAGTKVTLVALAPTRPRYLLPVHAGQTPHVAGHTFFHDGRQAGLPRWSLGVLLPTSMRGHTFWTLGIKVGRTVYNVKVRVTN